MSLKRKSPSVWANREPQRDATEQDRTPLECCQGGWPPASRPRPELEAGRWLASRRGVLPPKPCPRVFPNSSELTLSTPPMCGAAGRSHQLQGRSASHRTPQEEREAQAVTGCEPPGRGRAGAGLEPKLSASAPHPDPAWPGWFSPAAGSRRVSPSPVGSWPAAGGGPATGVLRLQISNFGGQ